MAVEQFANLAQTTLNGSIISGAGTLVVTSATLFPSTGQFRIIIDGEIILVTSVSGTTFTITRGAEGTTAAAHASGALVTHVFTAASVQNSLNGMILTVSGTNTCTVTLPGSPTAVPAGPFFLKFPNTNTAGVTLNPNSLGASNVEWNGAVLAAGQIIGGTTYTVVFAPGDGFYTIIGATSPPQVTVFLTGAGTFTTPAGCKWLEVEVNGDGAGGVSGGGTSPVAPVAGSGSTVGSSFLTANGGAIGTSGNGGLGGGAAGGDLNLAGGRGQTASNFTVIGFTNFGGNGGNNSAHAGGGWGDAGNGLSGVGNTGGGGAGGASASGIQAGGGGGAGGHLKKLITSPAATYAYSVGGGGAGGTATGGASGGAGGNGLIIFIAYF